jgi:hypothetical protein
MPCRVDDYSSDWELGELRKESKQKIDFLTRLLCSACQALEKNEILVSPELSGWWTAHKAQDAQMRAKAEQTRMIAESKRHREQELQAIRDRLSTQLTDDELIAIGLKKESNRDERR